MALPSHRPHYPLRGEGGLILPLVVITMTVGTFVILGLLSFASTGFTANRTIRTRDTTVLANEAAIKRVVADLQRGADAIPTVYTCDEPHPPQQASYQTQTVATSYAVPTGSVNGISPTVTVAAPVVASSPVQAYIDPGLADPRLQSLPSGSAYLLRLYSVKAGTFQVNWAYSPAGIGRVAVWQGCPVDSTTKQFFTPGLIERFPTDPPVLDTGNSPGSATSVRTNAFTVTPGIYSVIFDNTRGQFTKTTSAFAASGGPSDTWIYLVAGRDYVITATADSVTTKALVRQVPGYAEPPSGGWSTNNPGFIQNNTYVLTFQEELDLVP